jgi:hypothetical protein
MDAATQGILSPEHCGRSSRSMISFRLIGIWIIGWEVRHHRIYNRPRQYQGLANLEMGCGRNEKTNAMHPAHASLTDNSGWSQLRLKPNAIPVI